MIEIMAPTPFPEDFPDGIVIFLAGSIEMGTAEKWQDRIKKDITYSECVILNPRRDDWDSSWVQSIDNAQFNEQVNWEQDGLELADLIIFYFDPNTKSPITLMELGYAIGLDRPNIIVCCPDGFWRKGNVEIMCQRNDIILVNTYEELITELNA